MFKKSLIIASLIVCLSIPGFSQEKKENVFAWLNAGLGYSSLGSLGGVASFNVQYKRILFALRGTVNEEKFISVSGYELFDLGLLIGYVFRGPTMILTISTGVARVTGSLSHGEGGFFDGGHRESISPIVGLPFDVQIIFHVGGRLGLGIYGYLDINSKKTFSGIAASIAVMGKQY